MRCHLTTLKIPWMEEAGRDKETGQERFFVKCHKIKMNRKTKYFKQISIQVSSNYSLHDKSFLILQLLLCPSCLDAIKFMIVNQHLYH